MLYKSYPTNCGTTYDLKLGNIGKISKTKESGVWCPVINEIEIKFGTSGQKLREMRH